MSALMQDRSGPLPPSAAAKPERPAGWPAPLPEPEALGFGAWLAPLAIVATHVEGQGWSPPQVLARANAALPVASAAVQYGLSVFEGLKAYRGPDGRPHLFRAREHIARLRRSAARLCLPDPEPALCLHMIELAVARQLDWLPPPARGSLYLRPTLYAVEEGLGLRRAREHRLAVVATPCSVPAGQARRLWAETELVRAAPGGLGAAKTAANYAASLLGAERAKARGYDDALWLDAREHRYLGEAGAANLFVMLDDRVLTPPLDGCILAGITRDSVITLLREDGHRVDERPIALDDLLRWQEQGRLLDLFGVGTAARLFPISELGWEGASLRPPGSEQRTRLAQRLAAVQEGETRDWAAWRRPVDAESPDLRA